MNGNLKTILVFGGSGFIGSHLCNELTKQRFIVINADITPSNNTELPSHYCDVREEINLPLNGVPDLVVNLAAVHRTPGHETDEYYETNVLGAINIVKWSNLVGVKNILFTSSIAVYGPDKGIKSEKSPTNPVHAYGRSKVFAEEIFKIWQAEQSEGRKLVICRPAVIFGPGEKGNFTRLAMALKFRYFFFPGGRDTIKACGYVKDLIRACMFVESQTQYEVKTFNFSFPTFYSIGQICLTFKQIAGYKTPFSFPLMSIARIIAKLPSPLNTLGERLLKLSNSTIIESETLSNLGFFWNYDLKEALMDWKSNSLEEGLFK